MNQKDNGWTNRWTKYGPTDGQSHPSYTYKASLRFKRDSLNLTLFVPLLSSGLSTILRLKVNDANGYRCNISVDS